MVCVCGEDGITIENSQVNQVNIGFLWYDMRHLTAPMEVLL